jgi:phage-related protein
MPSIGKWTARGPNELPGNRIARTFFYVDKQPHTVLLHGIVKKTRKTPEADLDLARANQRRHERGMQ